MRLWRLSLDVVLAFLSYNVNGGALDRLACYKIVKPHFMCLDRANKSEILLCTGKTFLFMVQLIKRNKKKPRRIININCRDSSSISQHENSTLSNCIIAFLVATIHQYTNTMNCSVHPPQKGPGPQHQGQTVTKYNTHASEINPLSNIY